MVKPLAITTSCPISTILCRWITNKSYILEWISEAVKARRKIDSDNENEKELILFE